MKAGCKELKVYQLAYTHAMEIFNLSKAFPREETYSLTDQIRRSSRAVCADIAEGYRKRKYQKLFSLKITEADAESSETIVWLDFAMDCGYLSQKDYRKLSAVYHEIGKMLGRMSEHPEKFAPKNSA